MSKKSPVTPFDFSDEVVVESPVYSIDSPDDHSPLHDNINNADELEEENNPVTVEQEEQEEGGGLATENSINPCGNNNAADSSSSASTERINSNGKRPFIEDDHNDDESYEISKILKRTDEYNAETVEHPLYNKKMGEKNDENLEISTCHDEENSSNSSKKTWGSRTGSDNDDIDGSEVRKEESNTGEEESGNQQVDKNHQDHKSH